MDDMKDISLYEKTEININDEVKNCPLTGEILPASPLADVKWSSFPNASTLTGSEFFTGLQGGTNVLFPLSSNVLPYFNSNIQIAESQVTNLTTDLASKLSLSGGTMTGFLTLNADPTSPLQAVTKEYVDALVSPGEYLKVVNNLSDVASIYTSAVNLGVGNLYNSITSSTVLTAPLVRRTGISVSSSGQTLQLPDATTLNENTIGDLFFLNNYGPYDVQILDGTGSPIYLIKSGTNVFYTPNSNSSVAGIWYFWPWIGSVNSNSTYDNIVDLNSAYAQTVGQNMIISSGLNLLSGNLNLGSSTNFSAFNSMFSIIGSNASTSNSPNIGFYTTADNYPLLQIYPYSHGNIALNFDCYSVSGNAYSSYSTSNFQLTKVNDQLQFNFRSGINPGSAFGFQQAAFLTNSGNFNFILGASFGPTQTTVQKNALTLMGADSSVVNSVLFYTNIDQYPLFQIEPYTHNNVNLNFDCYFNGTNFLSSNTTSNFQISKNTNLNINYANGVSQGGTITWGTSLFFTPTGLINAPNLTPSMFVATDSSNNLISVTGSLDQFVLVPGTTQQMAMNATYIITGTSTVTFTLPPTTAGIGQITVCGYGNANWVVQTNAGQTIIDNGLSSSVSASSNTPYDNATFIYAGNNGGIFQVVYQNGNEITLN